MHGLFQLVKFTAALSSITNMYIALHVVRSVQMVFLLLGLLNSLMISGLCWSDKSTVVRNVYIKLLPTVFLSKSVKCVMLTYCHIRR